MEMSTTACTKWEKGEIIMPQFDDWNIERYINSIKPYKGSKTKYQLLFEVLSDQQFHCREYANRVVNSKQIAGSGGIMCLEKVLGEFGPV